MFQLAMDYFEANTPIMVSYMHDVEGERVKRFSIELLRSAINDLLSMNGKKFKTRNKRYYNAYLWIYKGGDVEDDFGFISYASVCESLSLDSSRVKFMISTMEDRGKKRLGRLEFDDFLSLCIYQQ